MATIYITSNADSGDGTLRAALASASSGDVITPAPELSGAVVVISETLDITTAGVTISGGAGGLTIAGGEGNLNSRFVINVSGDDSIMISDVTFDSLRFNGTGGAFGITGGASVILTRVKSCGCRSYTGSALNIASVSSLIVRDSVFAGNYALNGVAVYLGSNKAAAATTFINCTFVGNLPGTLSNRDVSMIDCKTDAADLVAAPPASWDTDTWSARAWKDWNLHIVNRSQEARGFNSEDSCFDVEGVPRVNGTLGAYETIDADLYWVGVDGNGDAVAAPSMESADGWADDRWATTGGTTLPSDVASLFVGQAVDFTGTWAPTNGGELTTGAGAVSIATTAPADTSRHIVAHIGAGGLSVSGAIALTNVDDLGSLTPVSPVVVDVLAPATVDSYTISSGVTLSVVSATFGALTVDGGTLKISESATVSGAFTLTAGTVELKSEGALLSTPGAITLTTGAVTSTARAYWDLPAATSVSSIEIGDRVIRLNANAGASNFRADTTGDVVEFSWSAASGQTTVLEKVSPYQMIDAEASASAPPRAFVYAPTTFRLWSGSEWLTAVASPRLPSYLWTVEPWALTVSDVEDVAFNVTVWGVNPNITHVSDDTETVEETNGED